jgi:hypothetical protein
MSYSLVSLCRSAWEYVVDQRLKSACAGNFGTHTPNATGNAIGNHPQPNTADRAAGILGHTLHQMDAVEAFKGLNPSVFFVR